MTIRKRHDRITFVAERCGEHKRGSNRQKRMTEKRISKKIKKVVDKRKEMW